LSLNAASPSSVKASGRVNPVPASSDTVDRSGRPPWRWRLITDRKISARADLVLILEKPHQQVT